MLTISQSFNSSSLFCNIPNFSCSRRIVIVAFLFLKQGFELRLVYLDFFHIWINDENNDLLYQYDPAKLFYIWRIIYAIGVAFFIYVLISRVIHLKESAAWAKDREEQSRSHEQPPTEEVPKSSSTYATTTITDSSKKAAWFLLLRHYGIRLLGTSSAWLLWDVSFYD